MKFELIAFDLRIYSQRIYIVAKDAAAAAQRDSIQTLPYRGNTDLWEIVLNSECNSEQWHCMRKVLSMDGGK